LAPGSADSITGRYRRSSSATWRRGNSAPAEELGRPAAAAAGRAPRAADLDHAAGQQAVEVAADRRRREAQPRAQRGRADRPVLQDEAGYPGAGAALAADLPMGACGHAAADGRTGGAGRLGDSVNHAHVFHNISVA
jgi:hypothetical protein